MQMQLRECLGSKELTLSGDLKQISSLVLGVGLDWNSRPRIVEDGNVTITIKEIDCYGEHGYDCFHRLVAIAELAAGPSKHNVADDNGRRDMKADELNDRYRLWEDANDGRLLSATTEALIAHLKEHERKETKAALSEQPLADRVQSVVAECPGADAYDVGKALGIDAWTAEVLLCGLVAKGKVVA